MPWALVTVALTSVIAMALTLSIKSRNYKLSNMPLRLGNLFEKKSLMPAVTQFFFMMAFGVVEVYVAIYAANCGLHNAGMYFIVMALATVAARIFLGRTIDRHGVGGLVYSGIAAIVAGLLVLVFLHNVTCFLLSGALLGFSFGAVQPSLQTLAMQSVAPERRGAANSTFFVAFDAGIAIGGFLAGLMVKYFSYDTMFLWLILPCVISLMCFRLKSGKSA